MEIRIKIDTDSYNSEPSGYLEIRRGVNRPDNVVIVINDDRQIEINLADLQKAMFVL